MLRALQGAFCTAFSGALVTASLTSFLVTVSGVEFLNVGSAFWGLVAGLVVAVLVERDELVAARRG
jgi:benzoate membrane transport protein